MEKITILEACKLLDSANVPKSGRLLWDTERQVLLSNRKSKRGEKKKSSRPIILSGLESFALVRCGVEKLISGEGSPRFRSDLMGAISKLKKGEK